MPMSQQRWLQYVDLYESKFKEICHGMLNEHDIVGVKLAGLSISEIAEFYTQKSLDFTQNGAQKKSRN